MALTANVGVFFCTIGCAAKRTDVCKGQVVVCRQFCGELVQFGLELVDGFFSLAGRLLPVLVTIGVDVPLHGQLVHPLSADGAGHNAARQHTGQTEQHSVITLSSQFHHLRSAPE